MLHAGLDLSRRKIDVCLLSEQGEYLDQLVSPPDVDALRTLARRIDEVHAEPVSAVVESMTGARLVHDTLEACGWDVEIADAQKVKGLAPLAEGRKLLERLEVPEPWRQNVTALIELIDHLEDQRASHRPRS
jgi:transposase